MNQMTTMNQQRGFTLLEIMVVVVIVGIFVSLAALSIKGPNRVDQLEEEARRLNALIDIAAEEAVMQYKEFALEIEPHSYTFQVIDEEGKPVEIEDDEMFRPRELSDDIELNAIVEGEMMQSFLYEEERKSSQILLLSSGEMSPFEITMQLRDGPMFRLKGGITGTLSLEGPMEAL